MCLNASFCWKSNSEHPLLWFMNHILMLFQASVTKDRLSLFLFILLNIFGGFSDLCGHQSTFKYGASCFLWSLFAPSLRTLGTNYIITAKTSYLWGIRLLTTVFVRPKVLIYAPYYVQMGFYQTNTVVEIAVKVFTVRIRAGWLGWHSWKRRS